MAEFSDMTGRGATQVVPVLGGVPLREALLTPAVAVAATDGAVGGRPERLRALRAASPVHRGPVP